MNSPVTTTIVMVLLLGGAIVWIAGHKYWTDRHRSMLEAAAGGTMSAHARNAYQRRDRHRLRWMIIGPLVGLAIGTVVLLNEREVESLFLPLMVGIALGQYAGSVAAAVAVIKDMPSRRVATLQPRIVEDYVAPAHLWAQRVSLLLPLGVVVLSIVDLSSAGPASPTSIAILAAGVLALGAGIAAPTVRSRLLAIPNKADSTEVAFWNNAIVSRAVGDLTLAVTTLSVVAGLVGLWSPILDRFSPPALFALWTISGLIMCGVIVGPAIVAKDSVSSVPRFITRNPPHRGHAA